MAVNIQPIRADVGQGGWGSQAVGTGFEGNNQAWAVGALLTYNANGSLIECTSNSNSNQAGVIVGIALAPAYGVNANVNVSATLVAPTIGVDQYIPPNPDVFTFSVTVDNTPSSNNAPGTGSLNGNQLYQHFPLFKDVASKNWYLCTNNGSNNAAAVLSMVTVTDFIDPPGTVNGRVRVKFLHSQLINV